MDPIQTIAFILMVLSYLTNVISGASLGNVELFNETFDAEKQHRTLLQNIQKNYADEFSNYEMADIENFLSGFMTPVKKEKTPIYTSKTFFGSDQFFGTRERSKGNSHHQTWDPFRANRVIGSQPSYFDVPDELFQEYIYRKNNHEAPYSNTGDNSSEFTRRIEDLLENKDKIPFSDITVTDKENNFSRSKDEASEDQDLSRPVDDYAEDELDELSQPVGDYAEDQDDELSHPVDDYAEDELDELSQPGDYAEDQDKLSHPIDDYAEDALDELSHPVDDDAEYDLDELSQPGDYAEDQDKLSHPIDDYAEDELDELSQPVGDYAEDELDELSQPVGDAEDQDDELSNPVVDDAEDELDELSQPVGDAEDQDELSNPVVDDAEDELDELSQPVGDDAEDQDDELSNPVDDDAEDELGELSQPVGDAEDQDDELSNPVDDDAEYDLDELSHHIDDDAGDQDDELSQPVGDYAEDALDELSHPVDDVAEDDLDELSQPVGDDAEDDLDELSHPVDDDAGDQDELSHPVDDGKDEINQRFETVNDTKVQVNELSHPINDVDEDELDRRTHPVGVPQGQANEFTRPINENEGQLNELIHLTDKPRSKVEDISNPVDETKVHENELSTSEKGVFDSKDIHRGEVLTEKVIFSSLSHSSTAGLDIELLDESSSPTSREDMSFQTLEGASESREDKLISEGEDVDSEIFRVDKLSQTKVSEDLGHLKMSNTTPSFENTRNDDNILPTDGQNENESHFSKILDEHLKKVQSVEDLIGSVATKDLDIHKTDIDEFQGSGDMGDSFDTLTDSLLESKSGRIIDIFPRVNNTVECTTPKGERGRCLSLTQCPLSDPLNNFNLFLQYVCLSRGVLVGICCPDNPVVEISDPTENSTGTSVTELKQPIGGCGLNTNTRIVGGKVSFPHEWTWMVALLRRNRFFCGGVIINDWYILTAAHCVMGIKVKDLKVRLGEYNFNEKNEHQEDIPVTEIKRHALFVTLTFQHDIALLKLKRRIEYTKFIGSICLPNPKSGNFTNVNATVVGWGTEAFGGSASPVLRQVTVPVWDNDECDKTYRLERITNAFMCAGSPENGEDACQGDSGGPLMALNEEGRWEVIGIVSWGRRCGDPTFPGVYTRVTSYLDWITENAN
ncbi:unnamed protein product [Larinioides sclopetarius]|uniref:Uncharacterized protein n=1 Tax=Larinioides sclopetarius TaxID=280406 RepID=A0AAV2B6Z9_9ARAC